MDNISFQQLLDKKSRKSHDVESLLSAVANNRDHVLTLIFAIGHVDDIDSKYAARILELAMKSDSKVLLPYLDNFCALIKSVKLEASIRACAKMIELLCVEYFVKHNSIYINCLTNVRLEQFIESCFDWMITDKATAIQAHSMYSLYLMGTIFDWIHPELIETINKNLPSGTIGFQNRGKKIIRAVESDTLLKLY